MGAGRAHWVTARTGYRPAMVAEFTVNHPKRNQLRIHLGVSDTSRMSPTTTWYPEMINFQGGPYAFDGSTTAMDGTFVFDLTDIAPSNGGENRYYLGVYDSASGDPATLTAYRIIDAANGGIETLSYDVPQAADASQAYAYTDYYFNDGNELPVAAASADTTSGPAPLTVNFEGGFSYDPDGTLSLYAWDFGDGGSANGESAIHTYNSAGTYTAVLTVTDNQGAKSTDSLTIAVMPAPPENMYVAAIDMDLSIRGKNSAGMARVTLQDENHNAVANAAVTGKWSGTATNPASGITGADGSVWLSSDNIKGTGVFTFTVTQVSASGYVYESSLNVETSDSISTGGSVNQKPVANAGADQTVTMGEAVSFSGAASSDPDGSINSYNWNFGDGATAGGVTASHVYGSAGTYTATLTVVDNAGATDSDAIIITVLSGTVTDMYISDISLYPAYKGKNCNITVQVVVMDANGHPVANASVSGRWGGLFNGQVSAVTAADGMATFLSANTKVSGEVIFTVTDVAAAGYAYNPNMDNETTDSLNL